MKKIKILIPVYNDWQSVAKLVDKINNLSTDPKFQLSIIIVNDGSNHDRPVEEKSLENLYLLMVRYKSRVKMNIYIVQLLLVLD